MTDLKDIALIYYSGAYNGVPPMDISGLKVGDEACDTTTGMVWEWTGRRWIRKTVCSAGKVYLGKANTVQGMIENTKSSIPSNFSLYPGDSSQVPDAIRGTNKDLAIKHGFGCPPITFVCAIYDTEDKLWSECKLTDGEIHTTDNGDWTIWHNFLDKIIGYDVQITLADYGTQNRFDKKNVTSQDGRVDTVVVSIDGKSGILTLRDLGLADYTAFQVLANDEIIKAGESTFKDLTLPMAVVRDIPVGMTESFKVAFNEASKITVDWGDGSIQEYESTNPSVSLPCSHTYEKYGRYTVKIYGTQFYRILHDYNDNDDTANNNLLCRVLESDLPIARCHVSLQQLAAGCPRLQKVKFNYWLKDGEIISFNSTFRACKNLVEVTGGGINRFATIGTCTGMFNGDINLTTCDFRLPPTTSIGWYTPGTVSGGDGYRFTFFNCVKLTAAIDDLLPVYGFTNRIVDLSSILGRDKNGGGKTFDNLSVANLDKIAQKLWKDTSKKFINYGSFASYFKKELKDLFPKAWGGNDESIIIDSSTGTIKQQTLQAGTGTDIQNDQINVLYDNSSVKLNSSNKLYVDDTVMQKKLTAGTGINIVNNTISTVTVVTDYTTVNPVITNLCGGTHFIFSTDGTIGTIRINTIEDSPIESIITFTAGSTTNLELPSNLKWKNGVAVTPQAGKNYIMTVRHNSIIMDDFEPVATPQPNQLWYYAPEKVELLYSSTGVVDHTFSEGRGVLHFASPITNVIDWLRTKPITEVVMPKGITTIDSCAFLDCTKLERVTLPNDITTIGSMAFKRCSNLTLTRLPESITDIYFDAFSGCTKITLTSLPSGVTNIPRGSFSGCSNLSLTELPAVTLIGLGAFKDCTSLTELHLNSRPTELSNTAFSGCTNLLKIYVPWSEGSVSGAPWGATNATIYYNS